MDEMKSDRLRELCSLIQTEGNQEKFLDLVQELNQILSEDENKEGAFHTKSPRAADQRQPPGT